VYRRRLLQPADQDPSGGWGVQYRHAAQDRTRLLSGHREISFRDPTARRSTAGSTSRCTADRAVRGPAGM